MVRPIAGIGVGLRHPFAAELAVTARRVDWLEIVAENWTYDTSPSEAFTLASCIERWPVSPHSFNVSLGGPRPLDPELLGHIKRFCRATKCAFWSDHLAFCSTEHAFLNDLLPLPQTDEAVRHVARRIRAAQDATETPLALENITYYARLPGATLDEAAFITAVLDEADCNLVLDLANLHINQLNFGIDAAALMLRLPVERVVHIQIAGHTATEALALDTHQGPVSAPVWELYERFLRHAGRLIPTSLEWDTDIPAWDVVADELDKARAIAARALEHDGSTP